MSGKQRNTAKTTATMRKKPGHIGNITPTSPPKEARRSSRRVRDMEKKKSGEEESSPQNPEKNVGTHNPTKEIKIKQEMIDGAINAMESAKSSKKKANEGKKENVSDDEEIVDLCGSDTEDDEVVVGTKQPVKKPGVKNPYAKPNRNNPPTELDGNTQLKDIRSPMRKGMVQQEIAVQKGQVRTVTPKRPSKQSNDENPNTGDSENNQNDEEKSIDDASQNDKSQGSSSNGSGQSTSEKGDEQVQSNDKTVTQIINSAGCRYETSFDVEPEDREATGAKARGRIIQDTDKEVKVLKSVLKHILITGKLIDPAFGIKAWNSARHPINETKDIPNSYIDLMQFISPRTLLAGGRSMKYGRNWEWRVNFNHPNTPHEVFIRRWERSKVTQKQMETGQGYMVLNKAPIQATSWYCVGFLAGSTEKIVTEHMVKELREITGEDSLDMSYRQPWLYNLTGEFSKEATTNALKISGASLGTPAYFKARAVCDSKAICIYIDSLLNLRKTKTLLTKKYSKHKKGEEWNPLPDGSKFLFIPQMTRNVQKNSEMSSYMTKLVRCHVALKMAIVAFDVPIKDPAITYPSLRGKTLMQAIMELKCKEKKNRSYFHSIERKWTSDPLVKAYSITCLKYIVHEAKEVIRDLKTILIEKYGKNVLECFVEEQERERQGYAAAVMSNNYYGPNGTGRDTVADLFGIDIEDDEDDPFLNGTVSIGIDTTMVQDQLDNTPVGNKFKNPLPSKFAKTGNDPRDEPDSGMMVASDVFEAPCVTATKADERREKRASEKSKETSEKPPKERSLMEMSRDLARGQIMHPTYPLSARFKTTGTEAGDRQIHICKLIGALKENNRKTLYGRPDATGPVPIIKGYTLSGTGNTIKEKEIDDIIEHYAKQLFRSISGPPADGAGGVN